MFDHDFSAAQAGPSVTGSDGAGVASPDDAVRRRLEDINPDLLAPREALDLVYELRDLMACSQEKQH